MKKTVGQIVAALTFVFLLSSVNLAQKISTQEQKIVDYVDAHTEDAIALLEKTVNIKSPTESLAGVKQTGIIFKNELSFARHWHA